MDEGERVRMPARGAVSFRQPVRELVRRPPVTCPRATRIAEAARLMQSRGVGSVVVVEEDGTPEGIVTDRDLRGKVVAAGLATDLPVARIMSRPLHTVAPEAPAVEALLEMLRRGIRHLPVVERQEGSPGRARLVGVVSTHDFLTFHQVQPLALQRQMEEQESLEALAALAPAVTNVVRTLLDDGVASADVARIVAQLNDTLVRRVLALTERTLAAEGYDQPPAPYCWLALGSEGRMEQVLRTDQDNALVYEPRPDIPDWATARYFERLAEKAVEGLARCGFPPCPAGVMATNARWRQPMKSWRGYFSDWIRNATNADLLSASVFFDLRPVWGEAPLATELWAHVTGEVAQWRSFLRHMAWAAVRFGPPLGPFGRIVVPRRGPGRGTLDVKLQGLLPLVSGLRVHALDLALTQTNTLERLRAASAEGRFSPPQVEELDAAYGVFMRLRLRQQLDDTAQGRLPSNRVALASINRAERAALVEGLRAVRRLQEDLRDRFATDLLFG
ncbi:DUF294 nucleotidyltransferase-like domain-containing protein [Limnochorda pilosa]|uniref:CBS domain-containing protein n=1 Tax=Limnochorda pilosa TaxID=1555112 RepID=A0A0K2SFP4_LIMPI|nr:DUF294 nucleotidyltransferase-like domain-containing protein [Limnochorda pilosa]BAS25928.1 hypothetical protein LIP_0071 [Limnochorda pilosa]